MPYGFPSGRRLVEEIRDTEIAPDYLAAGNITAQQLKDFREELREADPSSIDAFLEHRKGFVSIGKILIAYTLIKYERLDSLYPSETTFKNRLVMSSAISTAQCSYCGYRFRSISQYSTVRMMCASSVGPS